jgi:hypothetical protein
MPTFDDPDDISPNQRLRELAGILAVGVTRVRQRRLQTGEPAAPSPETATELAASCLEVPGETVLSVHTG